MRDDGRGKETVRLMTPNRGITGTSMGSGIARGGSPQLITETRRWWVVAKPAGWLSVPGNDPNPPGVVSNWAREVLGPAWPVHRLDRDTTGVLLLAKSEEAHREASIWFQEHQVKKSYLCCAVGDPQAPVQRLAEPIRGAAAVSQMEVLARRLGHFLARVRPMTGRKHQIRIHLAGVGHSLWGDKMYGGPQTVDLGGLRLQIPRVALHADELTLPSGESFKAPEPEDFALWAAVLRGTG